MKLDKHMGLSMAGLLSDGRIMGRNMETECIEYRWAYKTPIPVRDMVETLEDRSQVRTQGYGRRPFGVGLLIAAFDDQGPHIVQTCPSAHVYDTACMAIGARSQSARTYLERNLKDFPAADLPALIHHALRALHDTLPTETRLTHKNTTLAVVGKGTDFIVYEDDAVRPYIDALNAKLPAAAPAAQVPLLLCPSLPCPTLPHSLSLLRRSRPRVPPSSQAHPLASEDSAGGR